MRPSTRALGATLTIPVTNHSDQVATIADDGRVLTLTLPTGFTVQAEVVYEGLASRTVPCPTEPGTPNVARCVLVEERAANLSVRFTATRTPPPTEDVTLVMGCNNLTLTWPDLTPADLVARAISPGTALVAIWRLDPVQNHFIGWSPLANAPNDLLLVNRLDAVHICVNAPAKIVRPPLS